MSLGSAVRMASPRLARFLPVRLDRSAPGLPIASPSGVDSSGDLGALAGSEGFAELPAGAGEYPAGSIVAFRPWV